MQTTKRIVAALVTVIMIMTFIPTTKAMKTQSSTVDVVKDLKAGQAMTAEADEFWNELNDDELTVKNNNVSDYMKKAYALVESTGRVNDLKWEDEDTFTFTLDNGVPCVYDYEVRQAELNKSKGIDEIIINDFSTETKEVCQNSNVVLFGPYYGYDSSFKTDYQEMAVKLANAKGGTSTIYSGTNATPALVRTEVAKAGNGIILFDSHGVSGNSTSYFCIRSSTGISSSDLTNKWAASMSSGAYGIDGRYMTNGRTVTIDGAFCWFAICEGMMTDGLCSPLRACGASVVYGYSQSVSFTRDYEYMNSFWSSIISGKTAAEAAATMKSKYGNYDNLVTPYAYPIFVSDQDVYPQNPDAVQTVKTTWAYLSDETYYTVTFKDWNGTVLSTQSVAENENAVPPTTPDRPGYIFTGWDKPYTNITANTVITAQYKSVVPKMTFNSTDVLPGNETTMTISLSSTNDVEKLSFTLNYNSDNVRLVSVTNGSLFGSLSQNGNTLSWADAKNVKGNELCTITFEIDENVMAGDDVQIAVSDISIQVDGTIYQLSGNYTSGSINVVEYVLGDIDRNGEINTVDAIQLLRYLADWGNTIDLQAANINGVDDVSLTDALLLMRYLAGYEVIYFN